MWHMFKFLLRKAHDSQRDAALKHLEFRVGAFKTFYRNMWIFISYLEENEMNTENIWF